MANSNKVFVSPGVYTSELDLTYVAQSVGVTTLGLVGETMMGPAFEPVLIQSWDSFNSTFGGTNPAKDGRGNPAYELPYVASSYLQESNQLFVTRVLGLTGYKPHSTFAIKTLGGVNVNTGATPTSVVSGLTATTLNAEQSSIFFNELSGKTAYDGTSITSYINKNFSGYTNSNHNDWFTIGLIPTTKINAQTGTEVAGPLTGNFTANNNNNKEWYNTFFHKTGATDSTIDGVYSYIFVYNSGTTAFDVTRYKYPATLNTDYNGVVVAALRSRGEYDVTNKLNLEVTSYSAVTISSTNNISSDPFVEFTLKVTGSTGGAQTYTLSLDDTSPQFVQKVLGVSPFDKTKTAFPLYAYETYNNLLGYLFKQGYVRGLDMNIFQHLDDVDNVNDFLTEWDTPMTPTIVSEVRGGQVHDLFTIIPISDGEAANYLTKITIQNINVSTGEFDIVVRDFNDTDDNVAVLESWTRCSMDPNVPGYVALKVGTSDGSFALNSKYIMISMADNAPSDAFPAGFKGFVSNQSYDGKNTNGSTNVGGQLGSVAFKTKYFSAGDVMFYESDGTPVISGGETIRKVSLGLSSSSTSPMGTSFDNDLFKFKGITASGSGEQTFGFHLSVNAYNIAGGVDYQTTPYDLEGQSGADNPLTNIKYCKFTLAACGGFDGWDIYRKSRTNTDSYVFGKSLYINNNTSNGGTFNTKKGNSDYYAYLQGIQTYANPEAVNINVFATPGLNFNDHQSLTSYAIDMIENDRADSIYIIGSPNVSTTNEVVASLSNQGFDSNYSATYFPWIQVLDKYNSTQVMIPPTGEVVRNIALTDNVAYPWFASAGYSRGIVKAKKASFKLTLSDRDTLYQNRINPIATFSDTGTIIWGNKTLQVRESALDRINVRRLLLQARKLISAVAVRLLFEQNDETVRQEFLRLVNPILDTIKKERGLTDFRVTVSSDPSDIDNNLLSGKIYIQPTRSLEFIDLEFVITPTGASFENL